MAFKSYRYDPHKAQEKVEILPLDLVSDEISLNLYRAMLRLRRCEVAILEEYHPADERHGTQDR